MTEILVLGNCRCGRPYVTTLGGALYCENCDSIQFREMMGIRRLRTREDIRYDMYWLNVMNNEYPPLPPDMSEDWINGEDDEDE